MPDKHWVDFRAVKAAVTMQMLLARYGLERLRQSGQELRGQCPIHQGDGERSFHVNLSKNAFNCFSCHARGNVLDFVAALEDCTIRDAAVKLAEWYGVTDVANPAPPKAARKKMAATAAIEKTPAAKVAAKASPPRTHINPPLSFALRVDSKHEYGQSRGVSLETLEQFGAGLCLSKGTFAGRFVIPLHDVAGQLVGYAGRALDEGEPKYLFPTEEKGFYQSELVFNLHRVRKQAGAAEPVVVVAGFFDCFKVTQAGLPCVALLGAQLSTTQEELLAAAFNRFILCFAGDRASREASGVCLQRLARRAFVRVVELPDGQQPNRLKPEDLCQRLGVL